MIGHRDVPGKPAMYATTKQFLDYFGLKKLDELPTLAEIRDLDTINAELDFGEGRELNKSDSNDYDDLNDDNSDTTELIEQESFTEDEDNTDITAPDERIDIDVELAALKETYKQIDSIENQEETEKPGSKVDSPENEPEKNPDN